MNEKRLSIFLRRVVPDYVRYYHPKFSLFIEKYFNFLEQDEEVYDYTANILKYMDVDTTKDSFLEDFIAQYMSTFPRVGLEHVRFLLKHIREFYLAKGDKTSYSTLFKFLYDEQNFSLYYPKVDILKTSDGTWNQLLKLTTTDLDAQTASEIVDSKVYTTTSVATAFVAGISTPVGEGTFPLYEADGSLTSVDMGDDFDLYLADGSFSPIPFSVSNGLSVWYNDSGYIEDEIPLSSSTKFVYFEYVKGEFKDVATKNIVIDENGTTLFTIDNIELSSGKWDTTDSWLSSDKYLQDNFYYQDFSYEIQADTVRYDHESLVFKSVHPSGFLMFSRNFVEHNYQNSLLDVDTAYHNAGTDNAYTLWWTNDSYTTTALQTEATNIFMSVNGLKVSETITFSDLTIAGTYTDQDIIILQEIGNPTGVASSFVGDGVEDTFNIGEAYVDLSMLVFLDGKKQSYTVDFTASGNTIIFDIVPVNNADIKVLRYTQQNKELINGVGNSASLSLTYDPYCLNKCKVLVFIDGILTYPLSYDTSNNILIFSNTLTEGINNIEVLYIKALGIPEFVTLIDTVTKYNINKNMNEFHFIPESNINIYTT